MRTGRPKVELLLTDDERSQLQSFARSQSLTAALGARARIVLSSADGELNNAIAERLGVAVGCRHNALDDSLATGDVFLKLLPLLADMGITTLREALEASEKTYYARIKY